MAWSKIFPALSFLYSLMLLKNPARGADNIGSGETAAAANFPPGKVTEITSDQQFDDTLTALRDKLVVVDYTASWCGPCRFMAPVFVKFAVDNPNVTFLKVDINECKGTAQSQQIKSIPTFACYRGMKQLSFEVGSDKVKVGTMIANEVDRMAQGNDDSNLPSSSASTTHQNLISYVDKNQSECLNCQNMDNAKFQRFLERGDRYVESNSDDSEILLSIVFAQPVKLYSLRIEAPSSNGPKRIRLYVNQPNAIDFSSATDNGSVKTDQKFDLTPENLKGEPARLLRRSFCLVNRLQILVQSNQSGVEQLVTRIDKLVIEGWPLEATNMGELQRHSDKGGFLEG